MTHCTIIIPTLNEASNIDMLLDRIGEMARKNLLIPEVLFVDDGSKDGTVSRIENYAGDLEITLIERTERGLAGAVMEGARRAAHELLVIMDGDLSHPPEAIPELIARLKDGTNDMAIGSRYVTGGSTTGWPLSRLVGSRLASLPAHFLTGVEDPLSGFFATRKNLLLATNPHGSTFKIGFELLCHHGNGLRVVEIPIHFSDRRHGQSKMRPSVVFLYGAQLFSAMGLASIPGKGALVLLAGTLAALFDMGIFLWLVDSTITTATAHMAGFLITIHLLFFYGIQTVYSYEQLCSARDLLRGYRRLLTITLPVLLLRGGLITLFPLSNEYAIPAAIIMGCCTMLCWLIYVSSLQTANKSSGVLFGRAVICLVGYSLLLRFTYLGTIELLQEEAYYWNYAQHLAPGYLDHPPIVAVLIWLGTSLFGNTELGIRLGSFFCWFITTFFCHGLTRNMFGGRAAVNSVLFAALLPIFFGSALVMTPDAPLLACWSATLYFLYRALVQGHERSWLFCGIAFGLGLSSKYTIVLLLPAIIGYLLIVPSSRRWLHSPMPYAGGLIALLFFSPVIWWNIHNGWASFLFQSHGRVADVTMFSTHTLLLSIAILLTPLGLLAAAVVLFQNSKTSNSFWLSTLNGQANRTFTMVMTLAPLAIFFFFSFSREVKMNWTGPIWLAVLPAVASLTLPQMARVQTGPLLRRVISGGWPKTCFCLILLYGIGLHYLSVGLPGVPYLKNNILLGWDDLARQVVHKKQQFENNSGREVVIVGMDKYRIASGLSFYSHKQGGNGENLVQATGRHLFGLNSLMFSYWHPSIHFSHQDVMVLSQSKIGLHPHYFRKRAMSIGNIEELTIEKQGQPVTTYYYRLLTGYIPAADTSIARQETP